MEECGYRKAEEGFATPSHGSRIKQWLQRLRDSGFAKDGAGTDSAGQSERADCARQLRKRLLVLVLVLLALTLMLLLLFWNYQYIVVWKLLQDQTYTSFPTFGGVDEKEAGGGSEGER